MIVHFTDGMAVIEMNHEQLGALRCALEEGVSRLESAALYHKAMKNSCASSSAQTARLARKTADELERAVQRHIRKNK